MNFGRWMILAVLVCSPLGRADAHRWQDSGTGVLTDVFTGLSWTQHDNLGEIDWKGAKRYCDTLSLDGAGWRLPSVDELEKIYSVTGRDGTTNCGTYPNGLPITCKVSSSFHLSGTAFWSATEGLDGSHGVTRILVVDLQTGQRDPIDYTLANRAVCVR
jgi:hypothetical protein